MAGRVPRTFQPSRSVSGTWKRADAERSSWPADVQQQPALSSPSNDSAAFSSSQPQYPATFSSIQPQYNTMPLPQALPTKGAAPVRVVDVPSSRKTDALQLFSQMPPNKLRRNIAVIHGTLLWACCLPPFILCINLLCNMDFRYFVGTTPIWAFLVMAVVCLVPLVDYKARPASWWFLVSAWLVFLAFALIGEFARQGASNARAALDSRDCMGFGEKRDLHRAYMDATSLYQSCLQDQGAEFEVSIENCPGYGQLRQHWRKELTFLKAIEEEHPCAGLCHQGIRLWDSPGRQAPACSLYISNWIYGGHVQCQIIFGYSVVMLLAWWFLYELLKDTLDKYWTYARSEK